MKASRKKRNMITVGIVGLVFLFTVSMANAATVQLAPDLVQVQAGETFSLTVQGAGFTDPTTGGGFTLSWDPLLLDMQTLSAEADISAGTNFWQSIGNPYDALNPGLSSVNGAVLSLIGPRTGDFDIMTFTFLALNADLTTAALFEFAGGNIPWTGTDGTTPLAPQPEYVGASVEIVNAVPIPGAAWLLGSGLIGLVGLKRRRKS